MGALEENQDGIEFAIKKYTIKREEEHNDINAILSEINFLRELKICDNIA